MDEIKEKVTAEYISSLIDAKNVNGLRVLFDIVPTIDIADACNEIDSKKLVFLFKTVKSEFTSELFTELSQDAQEGLIKVMSDDQLVDLLDDQFTDDLVDFIEDLPANLVYRILKNVPKERRVIINKLLNYKENTAGSIMTIEYLELKEDLTAEQAIKEVRKLGKEKETVFTIFIKDNKRNLCGTLDLDDLVFAKEDALIKDIMNKDYVTVNVNTDQEEVANMVKRYDLNAIAVTNDENKIIGIITIDDIVDVIEEEATEDINKMGMITPLEDSYLETPVKKMVLKCVPWILILLVLGTFSSLVISKFESALAASAILAAFIPVLMDTGGNAGGQTIALIIRGLALKELEPKKFWQIIWKELRTAVFSALIIAAFSFIWFSFEQYMGIVNNGGISVWTGNCWTIEFFGSVARVSGAVAITMFFAVIISKIIAVVLPIVAASLKGDPAVISQPILTTIVDVTSLLIYFGVASLLVLNI